MKPKTKISILVALIGLTTLAFALAQTPYTLIQPLPGTGSQGPLTETTFSGYVQHLIPLLISVAAVLAVLMIIFYGLSYALSEAVETKKNSLSGIKDVILGLLLALLSYLILYTINPDLVNLKLTIPGLQQSVGVPPPPPPPVGQKYACNTSNQCVPDPNGSYYESTCGGCTSAPRPPGSVRLITCRGGVQVGTATYGDGIKAEDELMAQCQQNAVKFHQLLGLVRVTRPSLCQQILAVHRLHRRRHLSTSVVVSRQLAGQKFVVLQYWIAQRNV